jgi:superfamily II DNA helicase RecQ
MPSQFKFFVIMARRLEDEELLNRFLLHNRVLTVHREFVHDGENSYWSLAVEYLAGEGKTAGQSSGQSGKNRIDYKEVLSPGDFAVFAKLREWRKDKAGQDGVPVYTIFSNEQLAGIAVQRVISKTSLRELEGVGESRVKKYGEAVIQLMCEIKDSEHQSNEAGG